MGRRTNTASWNGNRWRIDVQKDGIRKSFYSSKPGRTGQREANAKADAWLDEGINPRGARVEDLYREWYAVQEETTSTGNCQNIASRWKVWVLPRIGRKRITSLTEQDLQGIVNHAYAAGRSKKTLQSLCADLRAFCKYCRACKVSTFTPEGLRVPAGARYKGKKVLQPGELIGLRWADVHGCTVEIRRAVNVHGEETQGKNQNAVRSFILSDMARRVLEEQRSITGGQESVFCIQREKTYYARWKAYCAANGLTPCTLYELRHTFVSVVKTLPAGEVKQLVGHSQDMDTFGIYGHALTGDDITTAQAVNGVFLRVLKNAQ